MTINKKQLKQLHEAAKPIVKWIKKNGHPYTFVTVTHDVVRFVELIASAPNKQLKHGLRGTRKVERKGKKERKHDARAE